MPYWEVPLFKRPLGQKCVFGQLVLPSPTRPTETFRRGVWSALFTLHLDSWQVSAVSGLRGGICSTQYKSEK